MLTTPIASEDIFVSRRANDERLGNFVKLLEDVGQVPINEKGFVICGYPDDEGIRINSGRGGSALAPMAIRKIFYKMTPSFRHKKNPLLFDVGNLSLDTDLAARHENAKQIALNSLEHKHKWIALGGGHDYAFADGGAFLESLGKAKTKPLIINFDAHLDVRTLDRGLNSGTPFRRLLEAYKGFDFAEVGIQEHCNSPIYMEWIKKQKVKVITNNEILSSKKSFLDVFKKNLGPWLKKGRPTFLSIDIDAFSASHAMGASQSWPSGLTPQSFFPVFEFLVKTCDVKVLGIYEVSPPLDFDNLTSKLASEIIYRYIYGN